jgi:Right handed beta helix region
MTSFMRWFAVLGSMGLLCGGVFAQAPILRVPADYSSIQGAINAAGVGTTVLVAPGTYFENLNFLGKGVQLTSEQGPQVTIIDGNQNGPVISIVSGEFQNAIVNGFTIRNGSATLGSVLRGGGIRIENSTPVITGNIITNNVAADGGAGISSVDSVPTIRGNIISNNRQATGWSGGIGGGGMSFVGLASPQVFNNSISGNSWATANGGGISVFAGGKPMIRDNLITSNSAGGQGGGISLRNHSDAIIIQNIIAGNSASSGGGIDWVVPSGHNGPWLIHNTITGNVAQEGSAVFADGFDAGTRLINNLLIAMGGQNTVTCGALDPGSTPIFLSNDVVSSSGLAYSGSCANQTGLNGNISQDPLFKNVTGGDYHLLNGSPAIDAASTPPDIFGPLTADLDGLPRPVDGNGDGVAKYDMGVYEVPLFDPVPPTTTFALTPTPNAAGWNNSNALVTLTADDGSGSGVQSIRYALSGAQTSPVTISGNPATILTTAEGSTTVQYSAVDNAGNVESPKTATVLIDKTLPVIAGMPVDCSLSPPKHQLVQIATITASDLVSGLADFTVTATSSEADSGLGGGDVAGDIVISGGTVQLRAEKAPSSKGRTYTILATSTDLAGNTAAATTTCKVTK